MWFTQSRFLTCLFYQCYDEVCKSVVNEATIALLLLLNLSSSVLNLSGINLSILLLMSLPYLSLAYLSSLSTAFTHFLSAKIKSLSAIFHTRHIYSGLQALVHIVPGVFFPVLPFWFKCRFFTKQSLIQWAKQNANLFWIHTSDNLCHS